MEEIRPYNKHLKSVRRFDLLIIILLFLSIGYLDFAFSITKAQTYVNPIIISIGVFCMIILPTILLVLNIYGLSVMDRKKETGFRGGIIRTLLLVLLLWVGLTPFFS